MRFLLLLLILVNAAETSAQTGFFYTLFVRSGPNLVKLLVEKRADLTVGIVAGAIVTAGDKAISPIFAEKAPGGLTPEDREALQRFRESMTDLKNCTGLSGKIASCPGDVKLGREEPAPEKTLKEASGLITGTMLTSDFDNRPDYALGKSLDRFHLPGTFSAQALEPVPSPSSSPSPQPLLQGKFFAERMAEVTFWLSIQNSAFIPDFEEYLHRYPNGDFHELAERRLALLKAQIQPAPVPAPLACDEGDDAIMAPIRFLYSAINSRNMQIYVQPWAEQATYRTYSNTVRLAKQQLFEDRSRAFQRWLSVRQELAQYRILRTGLLGTATVRTYYYQNIILAGGGVVHDQAAESYSLICGNDGLWRIAEIILYD